MEVKIRRPIKDFACDWREAELPRRDGVDRMALAFDNGSIELRETRYKEVGGLGVEACQAKTSFVTFQARELRALLDALGI